MEDKELLRELVELRGLKEFLEGNTDALKLLKGLSWNVHKNNQRLDTNRFLLEDIAGILHEIKELINNNTDEK